MRARGEGIPTLRKLSGNGKRHVETLRGLYAEMWQLVEAADRADLKTSEDKETASSAFEDVDGRWPASSAYEIPDVNMEDVDVP